MMNVIYLNQLKNNWMHSYGMQVDNTMHLLLLLLLLPSEAFLTECEWTIQSIEVFEKLRY
jgi:hypothetical protein